MRFCLVPVGPYARPISHIAASLGIPPSLISLRHRATHEDLPPLTLLRQAVHSTINYIHHYSFLPLLATHSTEPIRRTKEKTERIEGLVKNWKTTMKGRLKHRDDLEGHAEGREMKRLKAQFEAEDCEHLCEVLCGQGGLVPIARK